MPLKRVAIGLCDGVEPLARRVGAVNTMLLEGGVRSGHNTDVPGLQAALGEAGLRRVDSALVVGTGATARSAVAAVAGMGCRQLVVAGRSLKAAGEVVDLARSFAVEAEVGDWPTGDKPRPGRWPPVHVAVSTVPVAAQPGLVEATVAAAEVVADVAYDPPTTPLLRAAEAAGRQTVGGFAMLVHQAARQVELMTGCPQAPVAQMREAGLAALAARTRR